MRMRLIVAVLMCCSVPTSASPVIWDFVTNNIIVAELTLPAPDSAGSAIWPLLGSVATYTGDNFYFNYDFPNHQPLTPTFTPDMFGCEARYQLCDFNISWVESNNQLSVISIKVDAFDDSIRLNLTSGEIASTGLPFAPCASDSTCRINGSWIDAPSPAVEPSSFALLGGSLGFLGMIGWSFNRNG